MSEGKTIRNTFMCSDWTNEQKAWFVYWMDVATGDNELDEMPQPESFKNIVAFSYRKPNVPVEIFTGVRDGQGQFSHRDHVTDPICVTEKGMEEKVAFCVERVRQHYREKIETLLKELDELEAERQIKITVDEGLKAELLSGDVTDTLVTMPACIEDLQVKRVCATEKIRTTVVLDELLGHPAYIAQLERDAKEGDTVKVLAARVTDVAPNNNNRLTDLENKVSNVVSMNSFVDARLTTIENRLKQTCGIMCISDGEGKRHIPFNVQGGMAFFEANLLTGLNLKMN